MRNLNLTKAFFFFFIFLLVQSETANAQTSNVSAKDWLEKAEQTKSRDSITIYTTNAIRLESNNIDAYLKRGINYRYLKSYIKAEADFNKILSIKPNHAPSYYQKSYIKFLNNKYDEATPLIDKAISFDYKNDVYHTLRGEIKYSQKFYKSAIVAFSTAINLKNHPYDYNKRGLAYHFDNQLDKAESDYRKAIELKPDVYHISYNNLGVICEKRGEFIEARLYYGKAKKILPNHELYQNNYNKMDKYLAKSRQHKYDPTPLGFQIGTTSYSKIKAQVPASNFKYSGKNKWNDGAMYESARNTFEVDGLKSVTFIFDEDNMLDAVMMNMNKSRFDAVYQYLQSKYTLVSKNIPHVGNKFVKFKKGNSIIIIEALHMGFDMTVIYKTKDFDQQYIRGRRIEKQQKERKQSSKF